MGGLFSLRNPYYTLSGRVYTCFLLFGYIDAFGMLFTAKFLSSLTPETNIEFFDTYLHITIACACVSLTFLWIIKNRLMVQTYNWMWWSTDTPREHFSNWIWNNNVYDDFGPDMDDHRASALSYFRPEYYKHDLRVKDWLDSKWSEWERDPPEWFDDAFIASLPPEWLPAHLRPERRDGIQSKIISQTARSKTRTPSPSRRSRRVLPEEDDDEVNDILDQYDDATLRAFFQKFLKQNNLEKSFKEHIAAEVKVESEVGEASTVVPVNVQRKRRKSSVRGRRRSSFIMKQAPPDQHRVEGTTIEEKEANLSTKLLRIRERGGVRGFSDDTKYQMMAFTWLDAIKDYLSVEAAMKDWTFAWMLDNDSPIVKILDALKYKQALLLKTALVGKAARCLASLAITTFDNGTDILLALEYFQRGETSWGATTLAFPILSNLFQSLLAVADGDHPFITLAALVGLKPFIDTWRAITGAEQGKRKFNPVHSMAFNRGIEIVVESVPQTFFQMIRMVLSVAANDAISTIQYFTVISSFAAIGFIFAIMDYEVDTSEILRRIEAKVYGWIPTPKSKRVLLLVLSMLHTSAYAAMRVTGGVVLMYVHPIVFAAWALTLFSVFTLIKLSRKTYAFYQRLPGFVSHLVHLLVFITLYVGGWFYLKESILYRLGSRIHLFPSIWLHRRVWYAIYRQIPFIFDAGNKLEFFDTYLHITIACACVSLTFLWIIKNRLHGSDVQLDVVVDRYAARTL